MPVTGTPVGTPAAADLLDPGRLNIHVPEVTQVYGDSLLSKKRAIRVIQSSTCWLRMPMIDEVGNPLDLESYGFTTGDDVAETSDSLSSEPATNCAEGYACLSARFREASLTDVTTYSINGTVPDAANGIIRVQIPPQVADNTGVWLGEVGIVDADGELIYTNEIYVYVVHSAWSDDPSAKGPPSVDDVRLSIRDSDILENELLENHTFDLAEFCYAATRVVDYWNTSPPILAAASYNTRTFPFRDIWLKGMQLYLFELLEEHYRKSRLPHSAGGTSVDDKAKAPEYNAAWKERMTEFRRMVLHQKARLNADSAYGTFTSGYPH